jgi:hypothetical protein
MRTVIGDLTDADFARSRIESLRPFIPSGAI